MPSLRLQCPRTGSAGIEYFRYARTVGVCNVQRNTHVHRKRQGFDEACPTANRQAKCRSHDSGTRSGLSWLRYGLRADQNHGSTDDLASADSIFGAGYSGCGRSVCPMLWFRGGQIHLHDPSKIWLWLTRYPPGLLPFSARAGWGGKGWRAAWRLPVDARYPYLVRSANW